MLFVLLYLLKEVHLVLVSRLGKDYASNFNCKMKWKKCKLLFNIHNELTDILLLSELLMIFHTV